MALKINNTNYAPIVLDLSTKELVDGTITSIETNVTTIPTYAFFNCTELTSVVAPNATLVQSNAFYGCNKLEYIDLRNCVTIGNNAFNGCTNLKTVIVSDKLRNCYTNLTGSNVAEANRKIIFISDDVAKWTQINFSSAFNTRYTLYFKDTRYPQMNEEIVTSISLPANMTTINRYSLWHMMGLTRFSAIYDNQIPDGALYDTNVITLSVSNNALSYTQDNYNCVGRYFSGGTYETQANTGANNVKYLRICSDVKPHFCYGLTNLARVELASDDTAETASHYVETIGASAFEGCTGLSMLTLPNTLHTIGNDAFKNCFTNATTQPGTYPIRWQPSIIYIGSQYSTSTTYGWGNISFGNTFSNPAYVAKNSNTTVPSTIRTYATTNDYINGSYGYNNYSYFTEYVSSNNTITTSIGAYAFYGQSQLTTADFTSGNITSIGRYAFAYTNISTLTLGSAINKIPSYCFYNCPISSSFTIGPTISEVEAYAFGSEIGQSMPTIPSITIDDAFTNVYTNRIWENSINRGCTSVTTPYIPIIKEFSDNGNSWGYTTSHLIFDNRTYSEFWNVESIYITTAIETKVRTGKTYTTYTELVSYSFDSLQYLTSLSIPKYDSISTTAIDGCKKLTEMTYRGTSSEFIAALKKYQELNGGTIYNTDNEWINAFMTGTGDYTKPSPLTTIHCTDSDIVKPSGSSSGNIQIVVNP